MQTVAVEGGVIISAELSESPVDQGQLLPALISAQRVLAQIGSETPIQQVLADTGYWSGPQITTLQEQGMHVLVAPRTGHARTPQTLGGQARAMRAELDTAAGKTAYKRRSAIVEPVFAQIKHNRGITRLLRRRREHAQSEVTLIATTHNLLKLRTALGSP